MKTKVFAIFFLIPSFYVLVPDVQQRNLFVESLSTVQVTAISLLNKKISNNKSCPSTAGLQPLLSSSTDPAETSKTESNNDDEIPTSRYVVQNRFKIRKGREKTFEMKWAERESVIKNFDGFRFFCMLRKIDRDGNRILLDEDSENDDDPNYISCTVWEKSSDFDFWRKSDQFKEIYAQLWMLASSSRNTKGKPKPAFWKGLLPETNGRDLSRIDTEGLSRIKIDGTKALPTECFVAMNRFSVPLDKVKAFETRFANRESTLKNCDGFRGFLLLRRDGEGVCPDDGYTHSTFSVWGTKANFDAWMASNKNQKPKDEAVKSTPQKFNQPPVPTFYEGVLVVESEDGL